METGAVSPLATMDRSAAGGMWRLRLAHGASARHALIAGLLTALAMLALALGLASLHLGASGQSRQQSTRSPALRGQQLVPTSHTRAEQAAASLPLALQAQLSAARAAAEPAFGVRQSGAAFVSANGPQGLSARYGASGVELAGAGLTERFSSSSLSLGGATGQALSSPSISAKANGVVLERGQLSEWYRNSPLGIEQGFTVDSASRTTAARSAAGGELALGIVLSGNATPKLTRDGTTLTLRHGSTAISYGALRATDATGRTLQSSLSLQGSTLTLHVETAGARYPLSIDPLIQKGGKLTGTGAEARFGTSMALSADGSTLIVGAPQANDSMGAAYVFTRAGESWVAQSVIMPPASAASPQEEEQCAEESPEEVGECAFGASVAISADGDTALIGDPSPSTTAGAALIYVRSEAGEWTQQAMLSGDGAASREGRFGKSVALSADGNTALVGVPSASNLRGGAWVFTRAGSEWSRQAALLDSEAVALARFGRAVALSDDGQTALIGGPTSSGSTGAAWTFTRAGTIWTQQGGPLLGGAAELDAGHFGKSVALSGDGQTALVGAPEANGARGTVWAYGRAGSTFVQQGEALDEGSAAEVGARFGSSVALSGDGTLALIGAPHHEGAYGSVTQWERSASAEWKLQQQRLGGSEGSGRPYTGASVALSNDGLVAAIGGPRDERRTGAAWVFSFEHSTPPPTVEAVTPGHGPTEGGTEVRIAGRNLIGEGNEPPTVTFGSAQATLVKEVSVAELVVRSPASAAGIVDVTVQTSSGTSAISTADHFRYESPSGEKTSDKELKGKKQANEDPPLPGAGGTQQQAGGGVLGTATTADAACRLSLRKNRLAVTHSKLVALRLQRTGAGACAGKLTLSFNKSKRGKRPKLTTVGTAAFSISSGVSKVFTIKLNKVGQILFRNHGGRLNLSLSIARSTPAPKLARNASVRLTRKKVARKVTLVR